MGRAANETCCKRANLRVAISATPFMERLQDFPWPDRVLKLDKLMPQLKRQIVFWWAMSILMPARLLIRVMQIPRHGGHAEATLLFTSGSSGEPKGVVLIISPWNFPINRTLGPYGWVFWLLMLCNVLVPQALWSARIRRNPVTLFIVAFFINLGMWIERFVIVITSLHRDFTPSMWAMFFPTRWDWMILFGSVGLFLTLLFLFIRFVPMISMTRSAKRSSAPSPNSCEAQTLAIPPRARSTMIATDG